MKIIRVIIRIYRIIVRIGEYIDFKKIADDFKGKNMEKRKHIHRKGNRRSNTKK